jgi:hypothetical protein
MAAQQKALWLTEEKGQYVIGPKAIDKPGPGELLVKVEAAALNPVSFCAAASPGQASLTICAGSPMGESRRRGSTSLTCANKHPFGC